MNNYIPYEDLAKNYPNKNKYELILMAAQRARQIKNGAKPLITTNLKNEIYIALNEMKEGKLNLQKKGD